MKIRFAAAFFAIATEAILLLEQQKQSVILYNTLAESDS